MDIIQELQNNSKKFNRIVIWGLKNCWHTHRFVFKSYYEILKKAGVPVIWVEDEDKSRDMIEPGDIIFSASNMHGKMVPEKKSLADYHLPIRNDVYYCLHAENDYFLEKIDQNKRLQLKFYNNDAEKFEKLYEAVHIDRATKTLYQPWGTDLLPDEFKPPVFTESRFVFWIGSIWKGKKNEGNISEIGKLVRLLKEKKLWFRQIRFIPNSWNRFFIRHSRLAPSIGGAIQVETNYLPDRMFKNISYGQLGFSNIRKFSDIFKDCSIYDADTNAMIDKVLLLTKDEYIEMIKKQQAICRRYTVAHNLNNVLKYI